MTHLLQFTINVRKSHRQPQRTSQLVSEDRVLIVWLDLRVSLRGQQHPYCERAICLLYPPFFCKIRPSSKSTNKNLTELGLEIQTVLTCSYVHCNENWVLNAEYWEYWVLAYLKKKKLFLLPCVWAWSYLCVYVCMYVCLYVSRNECRVSIRHSKSLTAHSVQQ